MFSKAKLKRFNEEVGERGRNMGFCASFVPQCPFCTLEMAVCWCFIFSLYLLIYEDRGDFLGVRGFCSVLSLYSGFSLIGLLLFHVYFKCLQWVRLPFTYTRFIFCSPYLLIYRDRGYYLVSEDSLVSFLPKYGLSFLGLSSFLIYFKFFWWVRVASTRTPY